MMTAKLKQAFHNVERLPPEDQDAIAEAVMDSIYVAPEEEEAWLRLVETDESQSLLTRMAKEVEEEMAEGQTFDFDPSGK